MTSRTVRMRIPAGLPVVLISTAFAVVLIACGGGGGGGSSTATGTSSGTGGSLTDVVIEFRTTDGYAVDASNIRVGDNLQMYLWGRDSTGQIGYLTASDWTTTAPATVATMSGSGEFRAVSASATNYSVRARGNSYTVTFRVNASAGGALAGRVRNVEGQGVPGALVQLFNSSGALTGSAVTGSNGTFRSLAPFTTAKFLVDLSAISSRYYNQFGYGANEYSSICPENKPDTGTIVSSGATILPSNPVVYRKVEGTTPPPPPPDCGL